MENVHVESMSCSNMFNKMVTSGPIFKKVPRKVVGKGLKKRTHLTAVEGQDMCMAPYRIANIDYEAAIKHQFFTKNLKSDQHIFKN